MTTVPFFAHDLGQPELDALAEVLAGPILTTGATVGLFEERFAEYLGCRNALGVTSCTGAMHLSLVALGIGPGDEVITTPLTFIATATAIEEAGATPIFVDVEPETGNLDASRIEEAITDRARAIIPVHLYGQMCDMRSIREVADRHGLAVVEDAAHCIEGIRDGIRPGQLGDTACFSFYATKNLSCGEGGAIVTNDARLHESMKLLRLHGMSKTAADRHAEGYQHWDMTVLGWKYNMDNLQAAMLLPQLDRIAGTLRRRHELAASYEAALATFPDITVPRTLPDTVHARHLFTINTVERDYMIEHLQSRGIGCVVNYRAIHLLTYFRERYGFRRGDFPIAERLGDTTISLPFYPRMPDEHVDRVVDRLAEYRSIGRHARSA